MSLQPTGSVIPSGNPSIPMCHKECLHAKVLLLCHDSHQKCNVNPNCQQTSTLNFINLFKLSFPVKIHFMYNMSILLPILISNWTQIHFPIQKRVQKLYALLKQRNKFTAHITKLRKHDYFRT